MGVGVVDPGMVDLDQHFPVARLGVGKFDVPQHLGTAELGHLYSTHGEHTTHR